MASLLAGCTVTERYDEGRLVSRSVGFGIAREAPCRGSGERRETITLGLSVGAQETVIGYRSSDLVCLPLGVCGAIFFVETAAEAETLRRLFPDLAASCVRSKTSPQFNDERE